MAFVGVHHGSNVTFFRVFLLISLPFPRSLEKGVSWTKESLAAVLGHPSPGVHAGATAPRDRPNH